MANSTARETPPPNVSAATHHATSRVSGAVQPLPFCRGGAETRRCKARVGAAGARLIPLMLLQLEGKWTDDKEDL